MTEVKPFKPMDRGNLDLLVLLMFAGDVLPESERVLETTVALLKLSDVRTCCWFLLGSDSERSA